MLIYITRLLLSLQGLRRIKDYFSSGFRRYSFCDGFVRICEVLVQTTNAHPDCQILYPVHLSPNVQ